MHTALFATKWEKDTIMAMGSLEKLPSLFIKLNNEQRSARFLGIVQVTPFLTCHSMHIASTLRAVKFHISSIVRPLRSVSLRGLVDKENQFKLRCWVTSNTFVLPESLHFKYYWNEIFVSARKSRTVSPKHNLRRGSILCPSVRFGYFHHTLFFIRISSLKFAKF